MEVYAAMITGTLLSPLTSHIFQGENHSNALLWCFFTEQSSGYPIAVTELMPPCMSLGKKNLKISLIKFCNFQCDFERQLCYDLIIWIHGIIQVTRSQKAMVPFLSKSLSTLPKVLKTIVLSAASERATITVGIKARKGMEI